MVLHDSLQVWSLPVVSQRSLTSLVRADEGNRQPFGLYSHPIHLAVGYPGITDPIATRQMIQTFLDWVQTHENVWIVSNQQVRSF